MKCPVCKADMVLRRNKITEQEFYGCTEYPECKETAPIPVDQILRSQGYSTLPGFD